MKILTIILARGGSKGIPRKNLQQLNGVSLIENAVRKSLSASSKFGGTVLVSSDDPDIIASSVELGAWCPFVRPDELAADTAESYPAILHALEYAEKFYGVTYDLIVYVQPTSPFWCVDDLVKCIEVLQLKQNINTAVPVANLATHPYKTVSRDDNGILEDNNPRKSPEMRPRQILPKFYKRTGAFYVTRRAEFLSQRSIVNAPVFGLFASERYSIDIDTFEDLEFARFLCSKVDLL